MNSKLISLDQRATSGEVDNNTTLDDIMHECGLDFDIELSTVHTVEGDEIPKSRLIRRTDTRDVLSVVGNGYHVVSNMDMLEPFDRLRKTYGGVYESAGLINNGRQCWVSASLPDTFKLKERPADEIQKRIMVLINHTGMGRNSYLSIAHRIVCNNQMNLISRAASQSRYRVRHSTTWEHQLLDAELGFSNALSLSKEFESNANVLNSFKMTENQMRGFVHMLLPFVPTPGVKKDKKLSEKMEQKLSRLDSKRDEIIRLFSQGSGNLGDTRWDALNAVTEFLDHREVKYKDPEVANKKMRSRFVSNVINGSGDRLKQKAMTILLDSSNIKGVKSYA